MATRVPDADALAIIRKGASRIVQVSDDEIAAAIRAYWTDTHNLAEGAGAAPLAAALQEKAKLRGKRVGLILSGGNIDFDLFKRWVVAKPSPAARCWCEDHRIATPSCPAACATARCVASPGHPSNPFIVAQTGRRGCPAQGRA